MAEEDPVGGLDLGADGLGDAEDEPAEEGAPQGPESTDDHGLEREDEDEVAVARA